MKKTLLVAALIVTASAVQAHSLVYNDFSNVEAKISKAYDNLNPLCKAVVQGDIDTVKSMIAAGENVNQRSLGKTPAHYAARYNKPEILKVLIENGASLKKKCNQGYTVKKYAELSEATEIIQIIEAEQAK